MRQEKPVDVRLVADSKELPEGQHTVTIAGAWEDEDGNLHIKLKPDSEISKKES
jgi:hypothetical protein